MCLGAVVDGPVLGLHPSYRVVWTYGHGACYGLRGSSYLFTSHGLASARPSAPHLPSSCRDTDGLPAGLLRAIARLLRARAPMRVRMPALACPALVVDLVASPGVVFLQQYTSPVLAWCAGQGDCKGCKRMARSPGWRFCRGAMGGLQRQRVYRSPLNCATQISASTGALPPLNRATQIGAWCIRTTHRASHATHALCGRGKRLTWSPPSGGGRGMTRVEGMRESEPASLSDGRAKHGQSGARCEVMTHEGGEHRRCLTTEGVDKGD